MAKWHISKDGTPSICKAAVGNCPLGNNKSEHFKTKKAAQEHIDSKLSDKYGTLASNPVVSNEYQYWEGKDGEEIRVFEQTGGPNKYYLDIDNNYDMEFKTKEDLNTFLKDQKANLVGWDKL